MDDVRYIVLSDLHLGDKDSILTEVDSRTGEVDPTRASDALAGLVAMLRSIVEQNSAGAPPPTLIMNGDFLELAFGTVNASLMIFERFAELLLVPGAELIEEILYLPGNHDHHLWEMARETQYRMRIVATKQEVALPPPRHSSPLTIEGAVDSLLLNDVLGHVDHDLHPDSASHPHRVRVLYPNLALYDHDRDRCVVIHHGHYVESLYHLFSRARRWLIPGHPPAETVEEIEAENFAWIDFVWSLLGRSGRAGRDAETLFEMLRYPNRARRYAHDLAGRVAPVLKLPFLPIRWIRTIVLTRVFRFLATRLSGERGDAAQVCSPKTIEGTQAYLFGPTLRQVREELHCSPSDLTFVFGHTHKPFEAELSDTGETMTAQVYNTGGWTVDTRRPTPAFGASVLFLNDRLDIACLRVFNDDEGSDFFTLRKAPGKGTSGFEVELEQRLRSARESDPTLFASLSRDIVAAAASRRALNEKRFGDG